MSNDNNDTGNVIQSPPSTDQTTDSTHRITSQFFEMFMSAQRVEGFASSADKIAEKLTEDHITMLFKGAEKDDQRKADAEKRGQIIGFIFFIVCLLFAVFVLVFFQNSTHFTTVLTSLFSFLGGLGVGKFILPGKKP